MDTQETTINPINIHKPDIAKLEKTSWTLHKFQSLRHIHGPVEATFERKLLNIKSWGIVAESVERSSSKNKCWK